MNEPKSIEITATDVESAISKGVSELGVSREEVIVEVIEEPGRRLLGLGTRQARVRLTVIHAPAIPQSPKPVVMSAVNDVAQVADRQKFEKPPVAAAPKAHRPSAEIAADDDDE